MLIDEKIAAANIQVTPDLCRWVIDQRSRSERFLITEEVRRQIVTMVSERPYLITKNIQFAKCPFPWTYIESSAIELDSLGQLQYVGDDHYESSEELKSYYTEEAALSAGKDAYLAPVTERGYIIKDNAVGCIARDNKRKTIQIRPIAYTLEPTMPPPRMNRVEFKSAYEKALFCIGPTMLHPQNGVTEELAQWLYSNVDAWWSRDISEIDSRLLIENSAGEVLDLLSMLLWINQTRVTYLDTVASSRRLIRGRPTKIHEYNVVKLRDTTQKSFKQAARSLAERASPRRHQVRSFWRHYNIRQGCSHEWPMYPDADDRFQCARCGGIRRWVLSHERGDWSKGYVFKERYEVMG